MSSYGILTKEHFRSALAAEYSALCLQKGFRLSHVEFGGRNYGFGLKYAVLLNEFQALSSALGIEAKEVVWTLLVRLISSQQRKESFGKERTFFQLDSCTQISKVPEGSWIIASPSAGKSLLASKFPDIFEDGEKLLQDDVAFQRLKATRPELMIESKDYNPELYAQLKYDYILKARDYKKILLMGMNYPGLSYLVEKTSRMGMPSTPLAFFFRERSQTTDLVFDKVGISDHYYSLDRESYGDIKSRKVQNIMMEFINHREDWMHIADFNCELDRDQHLLDRYYNFFCHYTDSSYYFPGTIKVERLKDLFFSFQRLIGPSDSALFRSKHLHLFRRTFPWVGMRERTVSI